MPTQTLSQLVHDAALEGQFELTEHMLKSKETFTAHNSTGQNVDIPA